VASKLMASENGKSSASVHGGMLSTQMYGEKRIALLIIDPQRKFWSDRPDWEEARDGAVLRMNRLIHIFRRAGAPIIVVKYEGYENCRPYDGDDGDDYFPGLVLGSDYPVIWKRTINSFRDTGLGDILRKAGVDRLVLAGSMTNRCIMAAYYGALDNDMVAYLGQGASVASSKDHQAACELICGTVTEDTVCEHLGVPKLEGDAVPVMVDSNYPVWDDSLLCVIAALANTGGGHFVVGYPKGVPDNAGLSKFICSRVSSELGIGVSAEPLVFCSQDAVEVKVPASDRPVLYRGQKMVAEKGYSY